MGYTGTSARRTRHRLAVRDGLLDAAQGTQVRAANQKEAVSLWHKCLYMIYIYIYIMNMVDVGIHAMIASIQSKVAKNGPAYPRLHEMQEE